MLINSLCRARVRALSPPLPLSLAKGHLAENDMLAVEVRRGGSCYEKLRPVGVFACSCAKKNTNIAVMRRCPCILMRRLHRDIQTDTYLYVHIFVSCLVSVSAQTHTHIERERERESTESMITLVVLV